MIKILRRHIGEYVEIGLTSRRTATGVLIGLDEERSMAVLRLASLEDDSPMIANVSLCTVEIIATKEDA